MRWIRSGALLVVIVAACTTVFFVTTLKPSSVMAFTVFAAWLVLPYLVMAAVLIKSGQKGTPSPRWHVLAIGASMVGIVFLIDVIFLHPDAQGAIAVAMTPLIQAVASVLLLPIALRSRENHGRDARPYLNITVL